MWSCIRHLIIKEILVVWRDRKSRIALIFPPLIMLLLLSNAATLEVKNISVGIYNQDAGFYSQEIVKRLEGSAYFTSVRNYSSAQDLRDALDNQSIIAALQFQEDFSRQASKPEGGNFLITLDGRKSNTAQIVNGYISQIVQTFNQDILKNSGQARTTSVTTDFRSWFNPNLDYLLYNAPCLIAILSMLISLIITSLSVAREREMGTFDQLLVSPLQPWQIMIGKTVPAIIIGMAESTLIMVLTIVLFGARVHGSLLLFYFSMVVYVASVVGVGLFISSLSQTQQQAQLGTFIFMVPNVIMSGYATPVENMPPWLQPVSQALPITHFLIIVKGIFLKGMGAGEVLAHIAPMAVIAVLTLVIASWMFRQRME